MATIETSASLTVSGTYSGPSPPAQAVNAGFTNLVFDDDFTTNTIAPTSGTTSGYNWYWSVEVGGVITSASWSVNPSMTAAQVPFVTGAGPNASPNGGLLLLNSVRGNAGNVVNSTIQTVPFSNTLPTSGCWQQGYFEAYIAENPNALPTGHPSANGWPAFWSWGAEGEYSYGFGSSSLNAAVTEIDFFEDYSGVQFSSGTDPIGSNNATIHNPAGRTVFGGANYTTSDANWHTIGCLWTSANEVSFYKDNVLMGSPINCASIALASTHQFVILGTGINWPMYVDWVRVWQV